MLQGYVQAGRDERILRLRDFADARLHEIPSAEVAKREEVGSLMPPTAQGLEREAIGDLLAYLFGLGGS